MENTTFLRLSPPRQRLVRLMQSIYFGRIENLEVRDGEPLFEPPPRVFRTIKLSGANQPRPQIHSVDFALKDEIVDLLHELDAIGEGTIDLIDVRHGLPLLMELGGSAVLV